MVSTDDALSPAAAPDSDDDDANDDDSADDEPEHSWRRYLPTTGRGWVASVAAMLYLAGALGYMVGIAARVGRGPTRSTSASCRT